ncbi:hypothetical protein [Candidatus Ruminimicrobium bovinum]|uniref:hypothetical protein n=1 Tax=Candidatus Ruminimicrobium bovinum TaxID=3242779 RepID=UPI0039B8252D
MKQNKLVFSSLAKTWIFDIDGTIVIHNGYKRGQDILLPGVKQLFKKIKKEDMIIFITSRDISFKKNLENFLNKNKIRYSHIIYNAPMGERILINDKKTSGLKTAFAINKNRNEKLQINFSISKSL